MPGLDPGIHPPSQELFARGWIARSSPAMTRVCSVRLFENRIRSRDTFFTTPAHCVQTESGTGGPVTTSASFHASKVIPDHAWLGGSHAQCQSSRVRDP
jgi:hypothetical protein